jgi:hypothetical protein
MEKQTKPYNRSITNATGPNTMTNLNNIPPSNVNYSFKLCVSSFLSIASVTAILGAMGLVSTGKIAPKTAGSMIAASLTSYLLSELIEDSENTRISIELAKILQPRSTVPFSTTKQRKLESIAEEE